MAIRAVEPLSVLVAASLSTGTAWLASAPAALAADDVSRLSQVALDPRVLAVGALLLAAAGLGFGGRGRPGHDPR